MQLLSIYIAFCALLAGRVFALNITVPPMGNLTASQFLAVSDAQLNTACAGPCGTATSMITACGDTNDACLCNSTVVIPIQSCEQCMFTALIAENRKMPDPRAGNQVALTAYMTSCKPVNPDLKPEFGLLAVPDNWDGPFGQGLTPLATGVYFVASLIIGGGAIAVVNSM